MSEVMNYFIFMDGRDIIALAEAPEGEHTTELLQDHSELQAWPLPKVVYDYMETVLNGAVEAGELNLVERVKVHFEADEAESKLVQMARKFGEDLVRITKQQEARRATGNIPEADPPGKVQHSFKFPLPVSEVTVTGKLNLSGLHIDQLHSYELGKIMHRHMPDPRTIEDVGFVSNSDPAGWRWAEHVHNPQEAQPDSEGATGEDKGPGAAQHD